MNTTAVADGPISSYSRVRILHLVQQRPERTIGELSEATGLHANTVREHLQRLIEGGYVIQTTEHRTTRGRPRTLYSAATGTPDASSPIAREKVAEAARRGDVMRRILAEPDSALGREATYQLDALVEHLEESGFEPIVDESRMTVELTPCPHAASSPERPPMLGRGALGPLRGVLTQARRPSAAESVQAARRPEECTVQLRLTA